MAAQYNGFMATHIGIGFSATNNPVEAFKAAAIEVKTQLNAVQTDLVIVFATASYASTDGVATLRRILQPKQLIGSVTPGVIFGERAEMHGVGVMAIISDDLHFSSASIDPIGTMLPRETGHTLAKILLENHKSPQRSACLYFYDGLRKNAAPICAGIRESLGSALPLIGAISADSTKLAQTTHFFNSHISHNAAVGLLLGGANIIAISARHSWQPLGKPRIIDAAQDNVIHTIDKKPAINLYENYFKNDARKLDPRQMEDIRLLYPMGIGTSKAREYLIRMPIDILEDGSIVCQGDTPTGSPVHLMITEKDACRQVIHDAAIDIRDQLFGKHPKFILIFESFMRRKVLGSSITQGLHALREILGHSIPIFGMYTLGEIAPPGSLKNVSETQLLNGSFVIMAIG